MPKKSTHLYIIWIRILKTEYEANDATKNLAHYYLNQVKVCYYPQTSYISFNMKLTCILLFHKMCVWLFHHE